MTLFSPPSPSLTPTQHRLALAALMVLAVAILLVDIATLFTFSVWVFYLPLCFVATLVGWREAIAIGIICTTLIGIDFSAHGVAWSLFANEIFATVSVWLTIGMATAMMRSALLEKRLEGIIDTAEDAIISVDAEQRVVHFNVGAEKIFGYAAQDVVGRPLSMLLPQNASAAHEAHVNEFASSPTQARRMGERLPVAGRRKDGSVFPADVSISKFATIDGPVFTAILRDVTERKLAEQRAQLLMNELQHRTKNLFTLIQAIASRSLKGQRTLDEALTIFAQRIQALSRSQSLLVGGSLEGATVAEIIRLESEGFTSQIRAEGPPVILNAKVAQTLALVVHELATNAMKYGALSLGAGHVAIDWTIEGAGTDARFRFRWHERNGPPIVVSPSHVGFGRVVLENAVAQDFHTQPKINFAPEGLCYEINAPLAAISNWQAHRESPESIERVSGAPAVLPGPSGSSCVTARCGA